jgi:hypothetical protein
VPRTSKVDQAFYEVIEVYDIDGISKISGLVIADFTLSSYKNGVLDATLTWAATEIGSTGDYLFTLAAGYESKGYWTSYFYVEETETMHRTDIEVRTNDIDTVAASLAATTGSEAVTFTLLDTGNSNVAIPDALINVFGSDGSTLITYGRTDSAGQLDVTLDSDDYIARMFKPGVSFTATAFTVAEGGGAVALTGVGVAISAPADPSLCRIYSDFLAQDGTALADFKVTVANLYQPDTSSGLAVVEKYTEYLTDAAGHLEFDVVQGTRIRVAFLKTKLTREFVVPNEPVSNLLTLFGDATDAFQVVKTFNVVKAV